MPLKMFTPDTANYQGIRPINIYAMRAIYLLMSTLLAYDVWSYIFTQEQGWEPSEAMNWSVWAAFTVVAFIGLFRTVEMIPILLLEIIYKCLWLLLVALPLWLEGRLSEQTTDGLIFPFALVILPILAMPWEYVVKKLILGRTHSTV